MVVLRPCQHQQWCQHLQRKHYSLLSVISMLGIFPSSLYNFWKLIIFLWLKWLLSMNRHTSFSLLRNFQAYNILVWTIVIMWYDRSLELVSPDWNLISFLDKRKCVMFWHRFRQMVPSTETWPVLGTEVMLVVNRGVAWESGGLLPASAPTAIWLGALQYLITSLHCRTVSANQWGWAIHSPMSSAFFLSPCALGL